MINHKRYNFFDNPVLVSKQGQGQVSAPVVSISCNTYNQINFIREAIEGFLMQKTSFSVEILIHDDASTDGTAEIVREYEKKYPNVIFPIYQTENQYSKGIKIASNYQFPRARGKYIALCEGDDYWTDSLKLQKQVNFLEANPDYVLCFHKVKTLISNNLQDDDVLEKRYQAIANKQEIATIDLLKYKNFIHTCSVVFKNANIKFPFEYNYSPIGDYFLFILLSELGLIHRIEEYMGVYRRGSGIYSTLSPLNMQRQIVQYHVAILSYLTDEEQKKVFLRDTLKSFSDFEFVLINQAYEKEKIIEKVNFKGLMEIIVRKLHKIITKQKA
jgi:glycosyltransferase involved in cell wall biosynthesis